MKRPARFIMFLVSLVILAGAFSLFSRPSLISPVAEGSGVQIILVTPTPRGR